MATRLYLQYVFHEILVVHSALGEIDNLCVYYKQWSVIVMIKELGIGII